MSAIPDPSTNHGLLKARPPTPKLSLCDNYSFEFYNQLRGKLELLAVYAKHRETTYGPAICEWAPGREPPEEKKKLLKKRQMEENECAIWVNSLSDTDDEDEENMRQEWKARYYRGSRKRKCDDGEDGNPVDSATKRRVQGGIPSGAWTCIRLQASPLSRLGEPVCSQASLGSAMGGEYPSNIAQAD
jgi:hypothetical protein